MGLRARAELTGHKIAVAVAPRAGKQSRAETPYEVATALCGGAQLQLR
jgi:hypothetical protein